MIRVLLRHQAFHAPFVPGDNAQHINHFYNYSTHCLPPEQLVFSITRKLPVSFGFGEAGKMQPNPFFGELVLFYSI
jgi:hypothetical protein